MKPAFVRKQALGSRSLALSVVTVIFAFHGRDAAAEVNLVKENGWTVYTDGRFGGFVSYLTGDAYPVIKTDPVTMMPSQNPFGGGLSTNDASPIAASTPGGQPTLENMRIRSGFLGNTFGFGVRRQLSETVTLSGYLQYWADIESESERKYTPMPIDARQGYLKIEGSFGSLTIGRQLTLFSRGAVEIDFLYGHGLAVGFPTAVISNGPAAGHIGTGVLGPGFAGGFVYSTPKLAGFQLNLSVFDPSKLQGAWDRTKWARPEGELTYDLSFGSNGKIHLFVNGAYQKVYRIGEPDSTSTAAYGAGYGARVELGLVHLGVAGHWGQGLGLYYALEASEAAFDASPAHRLRKSDGYYAQLQLALSKFDLNVGAGISRVIPLQAETVVIGGQSTVIPSDGTPDMNGQRQSLIKYQLGTSAAVVYHLNSMLHFAVDYFRADFRWQLGEKQVVNFVNAGATMLW